MRVHPAEAGILCNEVPNVLLFIAAWNGKETRDVETGYITNAAEVFSSNNTTSESGNINLHGSEACSISAIYTPAHPNFLESIEEGIRDLVVLIIDKFDWITYSSCEGHNYGDKPFHKRYISILPRNEKEYTDTLNRLNSLANLVNEYCNSGIIKLRVVELQLFSNSEDKFYNAIDIVFDSYTELPPKYFKELKRVYDAACKAVILTSIQGTDRS